MGAAEHQEQKRDVTKENLPQEIADAMPCGR